MSPYSRTETVDRADDVGNGGTNQTKVADVNPRDEWRLAASHIGEDTPKQRSFGILKPRNDSGNEEIREGVHKTHDGHAHGSQVACESEPLFVSTQNGDREIHECVCSYSLHVH